MEKKRLPEIIFKESDRKLRNLFEFIGGRFSRLFERAARKVKEAERVNIRLGGLQKQIKDDQIDYDLSRGDEILKTYIQKYSIYDYYQWVENIDRRAQQTDHQNKKNIRFSKQ